ncbi:pyridoxamine 5'-phosphate oxidase family protein [Pseudonocardia humida]|uniref:Pyridoxamine 5'-phosphate oxidase family protein n=1 Tax=Pseudonocardia humida TaxID=2800819 RepID=A0ABT1AAY8_9PSEU|nr:pyridoxamine 5'-phosphate oxidase family protein [Pseudonocardia humida]MCO1660202.1 pyridoxamine 5'-phosphate oxidase family protein [Pseudonocardia humida]
MDSHQDFLAQPRVAVLAVEAAAGRPPLTVPVWYHYAPGGDVTFFTGTQGRTARKSRLLERAGRFSLNVQHAEMPYRYVTVECTVTAVERRPSAEQAYAITSRYLPEDAARGVAEEETADPDNTFVLYAGRPDRWLTGVFD